MLGPILGIDFGTRRIGLAVSDRDASIAFPVGAHDCSDRRRDLEALAALARERGVRRIVVGLPLHMDGGAGEMAAAARAFADELAEVSGLPVELLDERWTSLEADRALRDSGRSARRRKRRKGEVDSVAAALILGTYLERARAAGHGSSA